jgi:uncharacterized protein YmfQ (DUF2313 family)
MKHTELSIENRIHILKERDPVRNAALIRKWERLLRRVKVV